MSEKQTHTQGPWYAYQSEKYGYKMISSKCGESIANHVPNADARLIAAAPELLEQCKFLEKLLAMIHHESSPMLADLRAILAKVEGETA
jgi:hypothetical protein